MENSKEEQYKLYANQLRHPHGTMGKEVGERMNKGNRLMNLEAIHQLQPSGTDRILEIGMGNGFFVGDILSENKEVKYFGCDSSTSMVEESILLNDRWIKNGQADFVTGEAQNLPFENNFFDKIFTVNTIYFWDDKNAVLTDISRTLKKNGLLIIALRPEWVMKTLPVTKYGFEFFTVESVSKLLASHGLSVTNVVEKEDEDVKLDDLKLPNAFVIVNAIKL